MEKNPVRRPINGTEGALRQSTTYDNHPFLSMPIHPSTYRCEDDLCIEDLIE